MWISGSQVWYNAGLRELLRSLCHRGPDGQHYCNQCGFREAQSYRNYSKLNNSIIFSGSCQFFGSADPVFISVRILLACHHWVEFFNSVAYLYFLFTDPDPNPAFSKILNLDLEIKNAFSNKISQIFLDFCIT